jgi:hypothetical protein
MLLSEEAAMAAPGPGAQPLTAIDGAPAAKVNGRGGG